MTTFPVTNLVLQGNADAQHHTILNLDLAGLNLSKSSVGLGSVDNTSDLDKPLSTATIAALALKENLITAGTVDQFWRGDKTFVDYGALALQDGETTLPILSSIGATAADSAILSARRSDYATMFAGSSVEQYGTSAVGSILAGLPIANAGSLLFQNTAYGVIRTNNPAPLIFGTNGQKRMRLTNGLDVGGDSDPGSGCITAFGTITGGEFVGGASGLFGLVKEQIPTTLRATSFPFINIAGVAGAGFINFATQSADNASFSPTLYADGTGRMTLRRSGTSAFAIKLDNFRLTANRAYDFLDTAGSLAVVTAAPASATAAGVPGQIAYDATHFYVCWAADTWVRATFGSW